MRAPRPTRYGAALSMRPTAPHRPGEQHGPGQPIPSHRVKDSGMRTMAVPTPGISAQTAAKAPQAWRSGRRRPRADARQDTWMTAMLSEPRSTERMASESRSKIASS